MATTRLSSKLLKARTHARRRGASKRPAPGNGGAHDEGQAYATGSNAPTTGELQLEVSIGRRVKLLRQRLQLTATELAAEAGLSPGMLSKIENGGTSPSLSTLKALRGPMRGAPSPGARGLAMGPPTKARPTPRGPTPRPPASCNSKSRSAAE